MSVNLEDCVAPSAKPFMHHASCPAHTFIDQAVLRYGKASGEIYDRARCGGDVTRQHRAYIDGMCDNICAKYIKDSETLIQEVTVMINA